MAFISQTYIDDNFHFKIKANMSLLFQKMFNKETNINHSSKLNVC